VLRAAGSCVRRTAERMHRDVICIIMTLLIMRIIVPLNVAFQCVVLHGPVCCLFFVCRLLKTIANPFEQSMIDFVYKGKCVCTCFPRDMYHMNTDPHRLPQYLKFDNARMSGCYGHIVMGRVAAASRCGVWGSRLNQPIAGTVAQKLADHISGSPVGRRCLSRLEDHLRQINFHIGASLHAGSSVVCACPRMWTARAPDRRQVSQLMAAK
jgi:hypothetical protein